MVISEEGAKQLRGRENVVTPRKEDAGACGMHKPACVCLLFKGTPTMANQPWFFFAENWELLSFSSSFVVALAS